jgi:hypothetical protein
MGPVGKRHILAAFPRKKDSMPILQEARWATGLVWTGVENVARTGIWSLERPACSASQYRLRYPGPQKKKKHVSFNLIVEVTLKYTL